MVEFGQNQYQTDARVCDNHVRCDDELMCRKGRLAEEFLSGHGRFTGPNPFGALEQCVFRQTLPYFDLQKMLVVPLSHGLLRGVGRDLWNYLFHPSKYKPTPTNQNKNRGGSQSSPYRGH